MRTVTATEASRRFSDLLDAIEAGETVQVTRGNKVVAEIRPAPRRSGRELRAALADIEPPSEQFATDVAAVVTLVDDDQRDPWAEH